MKRLWQPWTCRAGRLSPAADQPAVCTRAATSPARWQPQSGQPRPNDVVWHDMQRCLACVSMATGYRNQRGGTMGLEGSIRFTLAKAWTWTRPRSGEGQILVTALQAWCACSSPAHAEQQAPAGSLPRHATGHHSPPCLTASMEQLSARVERRSTGTGLARAGAHQAPVEGGDEERHACVGLHEQQVQLEEQRVLRNRAVL